jgi:hypothetical protein
LGDKTVLDPTLGIPTKTCFHDGNLEASMRGMSQRYAIERAAFRHEEGNETQKIAVKRGFRGLGGCKLLKALG